MPAGRTKFEAVKATYVNQGINAGHIDYAISAVQDGSKREHIMEGLTADYRGVPGDTAHSLLEALFAANGGEFKKENRGGYLYAAGFLMVGVFLAGYIIYAAINHVRLYKPFLVVTGAILGTTGGITFLVKAMRGKFRDSDSPFKYGE